MAESAEPSSEAAPVKKPWKRWWGIALIAVVISSCVGEPAIDDPELVEELEAPEPEPEAAPEPVEAAEGRVDADAVLAMLQEFATQYNAGEYIHASAHFTSKVEQECGGATALAFALSQNHEVTRTDYEFLSVDPWDDEPNMADIILVETWEGEELELALGYEFAFERGSWRFDDLFPPGAGAFCD